MTAADYKNGITIVKPEGLKITSYYDYQVIAQTIEPDFLSDSNSDAFPVFFVSLSASPSSSTMPECISYITCNSIKLSPEVQILITNTYTNDWRCHEKYYDLTFSILPEDSQLLGTRTGNFSTSLMLVIVPL
jgi:hypothetical protein